MTSPNPPLVPFEQRASFEEVRGCHALTRDGSLVRVVEWMSDRYWGERVVEVEEDPTFARERLGRAPMRWSVDESALTPAEVDTSDPMWWEKFRARQLEEGLPAGQPVPPKPRL